MSGCEFVNKATGQRCNKRGRYDCDIVGKTSWVCGIHKNVQSAEDECPICFIKLKDSKRIKLKCGHWFHISCLSKCVKRECPLCRERINPADCCVIYKETVVDPLTKRIFNLSEDSQQKIFSGILNLTNLMHKSEWLGQNLCFLCERFNKTNIKLEQLQTILQLLDSTMQYVEVTGEVPMTSVTSV